MTQESSLIPASQEFTIALSPKGSLYLLSGDHAFVSERIRLAFSNRFEEGLIHLGLWELATQLPPDLGYWRDLSRMYFTQLCAFSALSAPREELETFCLSAPPMMGGEYLSVEVLVRLWNAVHAAFQNKVLEDQGNIQEFFVSHGGAWNLVGRVCFHLAENKSHEETPFAFMATYSHKLSSQGKAQHIPLGKALQEYSGEKNKDQLLQLLLPVQKGSEASSFLKGLITTGEIFHPLAWAPEEAFRFLKDIPQFEAAGIVVRVPDWWKSKTMSRPQVSVTIGGKKESILGIDAMLDFSVSLTLDGLELTKSEMKQILGSTSGLALIRGKWVEIDREKLTQVLHHWQSVQRASQNGEISFIHGMRLLSGANELDGDNALPTELLRQWSEISAGESLAQLLAKLRDGKSKTKSDDDLNLQGDLRVTLREYQKVGVRWLWLLSQLGLGACLADDMGLGKTIQVISFFILIKRQKSGIPNLLVVPASLLGNWKSEVDRFTPSIRMLIVHPSAESGIRQEYVHKPAPEVFAEVDVVMTTYGFLNRLPWLTETSWNSIVIDEAQAIKNSGSKQTRAVKALKGRHRIALTGTPVENRLSDLWSLYDFLCPGLLGSSQAFTKFVKGAEKPQVNTEGNTEGNIRYAALRGLVRPYLLRRLKTDKKIIADLPDKTEVSAYCSLTKTQAVLYQQSVEELARKIEHLDGIQRRGVVLSFLMRFKQICNHPSQWLSDGRYSPQDSGKFGRLREICEDIATKQEKMLIFTQFREMTAPIADYLKEIFGRPGLILHGETAVKKRKELVDSFQEERGAPFFVLSLKAGGTGLNLTAASHVIHFDRWWNPAVENQATDRAFRIGQKKNVLVHKFICRGTIEEKIDTMISSKQSLSKELLEGSGDAILTELGNEELLKLVALDIQSAVEEG